MTIKVSNMLFPPESPLCESLVYQTISFISLFMPGQVNIHDNLY